jgi:hypothetical protein
VPGRGKLAIFLLSTAIALACNAQKKQLDVASEQHQKGQLDDALTTLEVLVHEAPKSPEAEQAQTLAVTWLIAAGDTGSDLTARRLRLEQALKWSPKSGAAQARLCVLLVETKDVAGARRCVDEKLGDKTDVPADLVAKVRAALSAHASAEADAERRRWAASRSAHHWKALIEKYPDSPEAKAAKEKLERRESLCADLAGFTKPLRDEIERQKRLADLVITHKGDDSTQNERIDGLETLGREAAAKARAIGDLKGDIEGHPVRAGEEPVKQRLEAMAQEVADSASTLEDDMERHPLENLDSYDEQALAAVKRWAAQARRLATRIDKELKRTEEACAGTPSR